ncbi:DUF1801 domain-containing protein [Salaquimonas pukyongi]|uniref:DUF1801 domain-containing protein n=1 Tax=Salaquimonas pukyongi TaxID=2712698 RepID=UPI00196893A9|nr:DUF1801 domain-containing protein [Salaquimonas pukyongi]
MSENKTRPMAGSPKAFIEKVEHATRKRDAQTLLPLFERWTGLPPVLWGSGLAGGPASAIIGFGRYHYRYDSGREGDFFLTGFSPRKQYTAIYIMPGFSAYEEELARLGPHRHTVSCLYLTNLSRNDTGALETMVRDSVERMKAKHDWRER